MRILSLDGGGILGLSSAAFLAEVERHFGKRCSDQFDLFCGTSTGAIISLALATGLSAAEVVEHYMSFGSRVFPPRNKLQRAIGCLTELRRPRYPISHLRDALSDVFGESRLQDIAARGKYALIAAFNLSAGTPTIFKTDHSSSLTAHNEYRLADIALASSAAPSFFPIVELKAPGNGIVSRYCDGGVFANSPALLGYAEALTSLGCSPDQIDVLSLSTPRAPIAERRASQESSLDRGRWGWKDRISQVMVDGTSHISESALERIVHALRNGGGGYTRVRLASAKGLDFDVATPAAVADLVQIGQEEGQKTTMRTQLRRFFE